MSAKQLQQQTTKNKRKAQIPIKQQACMHKTDSYSLPTRSLTEDDSTMLENKQTKQAAKISLVGIALKKKILRLFKNKEVLTSLSMQPL